LREKPFGSKPQETLIGTTPRVQKKGQVLKYQFFLLPPCTLKAEGEKVMIQDLTLNLHKSSLTLETPCSSAKPATGREQTLATAGSFRSLRLRLEIDLASRQVNRQRGVRVQDFPLAVHLVQAIGHAERHIQRLATVAGAGEMLDAARGAQLAVGIHIRFRDVAALVAFLANSCRPFCCPQSILARKALMMRRPAS
jgi:hypothetical protein